MESDNDSDVGIVGLGDRAKRSYTSKRDIPGKPSRKVIQLSFISDTYNITKGTEEYQRSIYISKNNNKKYI